jgi:hypothetical protein
MSVLFTTVPAKRLSRTLLSTGSIVFLENINGWDREDLESVDFGTQLYAVFRDAGNSVMELMELDPDTIASPTGITVLRRGLAFSGDRTTEYDELKRDWTKNTTIVELGSVSPQMLQYLKDYIDGIAISGSPVASLTAKGLVEIATTTEINEDTNTGSTDAPVVVSPEQLKDSKYGIFIAAATGMVFEYIGDTAPEGFLMADGTVYDTNDYPALAIVGKGRHGLGAEVAFTANAGTDEIASTAHGLANGTMLFLRSTTTLPAGLSANTPYYVVNQTVNAFKLSLTSGGDAVDITDTGTGTHYYSKQFKVIDRRGRVGIGAGTGTFTTTFAATDVNTSTEVITVPSNNSLYTGTPVVITNPGTLPTITAPSASGFDIDNAGLITNLPVRAFKNGDKFYVATQSSTNLIATTTYYVINYDNVTGSFNISETPGGSIFGAGNSGTGTAYNANGFADGLYVIRLSATTIQLAVSLANALAATPVPVDLSAQGAGTNTITATLSARTLGEYGGEERHALSVYETPSHAHVIGAKNTDNGGSSSPDLWSWASGSELSGAIGGNAPHNIMNPFVTENYIVKT